MYARAKVGHNFEIRWPLVTACPESVANHFVATVIAGFIMMVLEADT
jgi:hypothetical protein